MKPNKQRILSSQPTKPGTGSKMPITRSNTLAKAASAVLPKYPSEKQPEFHLNDIVKNLKSKKSTAPFKLIQFEDTAHTRKETTIINEIQQSYKFVSALSYTNMPLTSEEEPKELPVPLRRSLSEVLKDDEICNNTTDTYKTKPESFDLYFGIIPNKYWCNKCRTEVVSEVRMNLPTLSV